MREFLIHGILRTPIILSVSHTTESTRGFCFQKKRQKQRLPSKMDSSTLRGFGGGWNSIDEDLSMQPNFQVSLINFNRTTSGSQAVRYGQNWNCDIKGVRNSPIVDGCYFNGRNIVVTQSGNVLAVSGDGTVITEIWNTAIAASLAGSIQLHGLLALLMLALCRSRIPNYTQRSK